MNDVVRKAQFDEDKDFSLLKFRRADLDVVRSSYNLGVNEGTARKPSWPSARKKVDEVVEDINEHDARISAVQNAPAGAGRQAQRHRPRTP